MLSHQIRLILALSIVITAASVPGRSHAEPGVLEINQTCAVQTGCFPSDAPGFPVSIATAGSYRLTSNLVVPDVNTTAIATLGNRSNVEVDLGGFEIRGPLSCAGAAATCAANSGTGVGVRLSQSGTTMGNRVHNGSIIGMGGAGVRNLGRGSSIEKVRVSWNGYRGIEAGDGTQILNVVAIENGNIGIFVEDESTVVAATAIGNGQGGIFIGPASRVRDSIASGNALDGITCGQGSVVSNSTARGNGQTGFVLGNGSTFYHNAAYENGGWGAALGPHSPFGNNAIVDNGTPGQVTGGRSQGQNYCKNAGPIPDDQCF